jgi:hypothetical protein
MTGFMISSLYYRMSKAWKLIVSIGVPMLVFVGIPLIDGLYTKGAITAFCINVLAFAFGYGVTIDLSNGFAGLVSKFFREAENGIPLYPYRAILFSVISIAFTGALSFLLIRKATIKE